MGQQIVQQDEQGQRVEIDGSKMVQHLQQQRAALMEQIDMLTILLQQRDEQIAALLSERKD